MKKIFMIFLILLLMPMIVFADIEEESANNNGNTEISENIEKSPDTGVEDYFVTLGAISICLVGTVYVLNKKSIFAEI